MATEKLWWIRVVLSTGDQRQLSCSYAVVVEGGPDVLDDFTAKREPFDGDWLETTVPSIVARAHIAEASFVPL